jgi:hypothetical protein
LFAHPAAHPGLPAPSAVPVVMPVLVEHRVGQDQQAVGP